MSANLSAFLYLVASVLFILSLRGLSSPESARNGNMLGMAGMAIAILTTLASPEVMSFGLIILGILIVTALYLLLSAIYAYVLPIDEMARSKLVAADVAERVFTGGGRWIAVAVMLSTFGAANAVILTSARVYFSMSRDQLLPASLGNAHERFHTPSASLVLQGFWSVLL